MVETADDTLALPIRPDGYTIADLDSLAETPGNRLELVDGVLIVSPLPRQRHQLLVTELGRLLHASCPPDLVVQPLGQDVRLGDRTSLVPDLLVQRLADVDLDEHVVRAPQLVVEVISPSSRRRDLAEKLDIYAEMGIPSYWVLHPVDDWVREFGLREGAYEFVRSAQGNELFQTTQPFPVGFRPADLLARYRGSAAASGDHWRSG